MKKLVFRINKSFSLLLLLITSLSYSQSNKENNKITICHYPPGNPTNVQTITISENSWPAHAAHGDTKGDCDAQLTESIKPVLECVDHLAGGKFLAHFGYLNENSSAITIEIGNKNKFNPQPQNRGQVIYFLPGRNYDAFQVEFNGSDLVWTLDGPDGQQRTSTANSSTAQKCQNTGDEDTGDEDDDNDGDGDGDDEADGNTDNECMSIVSANFSSDNLSVSVYSDKDLSNVVLKYCDESTEKVDDLSGNNQTFSGSGDNTGKYIIGVWIKSGCNASSEGSGYGEYIANESWSGECENGDGDNDGDDDEDGDDDGDNDGNDDGDNGGDDDGDNDGNGDGDNDGDNDGNDDGDDDGDNDGDNNGNDDGDDDGNEDGDNDGNDDGNNDGDDDENNDGDDDIDNDEGEEGDNDGNNDVLSPHAALGNANAIGMCQGEEFQLTILCSGNGPWNVEYSNGISTFDVIVETSPATFSHIEAGNYELLSIEDVNGVQGSVEGNFTATYHQAPTAILSGGGQICNNESAELVISFTGEGPWSYSYSYDNKIITGVSESSPVVLNVNGVGSYELLSVSDSRCDGTTEGSAALTPHELPEGNIYLNDRYCVGDEVLLNNDVTEEGNTFSWTTTGSGNLLQADEKIAKYVAVEEESNVKFMLNINNGCSNTQISAETNFIGTYAGFSINPQPEDDGGLLVGVEYEFIASDDNAGSYSWDFGDGNGSSFASFNQAYNEEGNYKVTLTTSKGECSDTRSINLNIVTNDNLYIPNVISPSSPNPENNSVKVYGEDLSPEGFEFFIYNRWGKVVYKTDNLNEAQTTGWNGQTQGEEKGNNVFTYTVRGNYNNGKPFEETGAITLVK